MSAEGGTSLLETVLVLAVMASAMALGLPVLSQGADAKRTGDAADFLAGQFRLARQRAVMTGRRIAVVFDEVSGEMGWRICEDRDRDGVSRADIVARVDRCDGPVRPITARFPDVRIGFADGVPGPDGKTAGSPLRFGLARMAVFSPTGTASSGTVAIQGQSGVQFAVRVAGVTGRIRVLEFDRGRRLWSD